MGGQKIDHMGMLATQAILIVQTGTSCKQAL